MKKIILFILIMASVNFAQQVEIISIEQITSKEQGSFFYPVGNYDDSKLMFSNENYKGLWILDSKTKMLQNINNFLTSGYEPSFTTDGKIVFRKDSFVNSRRFIAIHEYDLTSKVEKAIAENLRDIAQIKITNGNEVSYSKNKNLMKLNSNEKLAKISSSTKPLLMIESSNLVMYQNGNRFVLNPLGDGNYLWASVSPNNDKLLFTYAGNGSYVTDLNGKVLNHVKDAHYPQWSSKGDWIVYMKDYDDGYRITESDLYVYSIESSKEFKITDTKEINEMYPVWSKSKDAIYCNSTDGIIYKIELKLN